MKKNDNYQKTLNIITAHIRKEREKFDALSPVEKSNRIFSACEGLEVDITAYITEADLDMIKSGDYDYDFREYLNDAVVGAATKDRFTWREAAEMRGDRYNTCAPEAYAEITEDGRVIARMDMDYPWTW